MAYLHQTIACESVMTCGVFAQQHSGWLLLPYDGSFALKKEFKDLKKAEKREDNHLLLKEEGKQLAGQTRGKPATKSQQIKLNQDEDNRMRCRRGRWPKGVRLNGEQTPEGENRRG